MPLSRRCPVSMGVLSQLAEQRLQGTVLHASKMGWSPRRIGSFFRATTPGSCPGWQAHPDTPTHPRLVAGSLLKAMAILTPGAPWKVPSGKTTSGSKHKHHKRCEQAGERPSKEAKQRQLSPAKFIGQTPVAARRSSQDPPRGFESRQGSRSHRLGRSNRLGDSTPVQENSFWFSSCRVEFVKRLVATNTGRGKRSTCKGGKGNVWVSSLETQVVGFLL